MTINLTFIITYLNEFFWLSFLPLLAFIVAITLPFRLGSVSVLQWSLFKSALQQLLAPQKDTFGLGITPRSGFLMSLATSMTAGHLIGTIVVVAIAGYGVLLYVWLFTLLLLGVKYIETVQSILFRKVTVSGHFCGGPMYVLKYGLGKQIAWLGSGLAIFYCIFLVISSVGVGNHLPMRFLQQLGQEYFLIHPIYMMMAVIAVVGLSLCYGVRFISVIVSLLMGASLLLFLAMLIYLAVFYGHRMPEFLQIIIHEAFEKRSSTTGASLTTVIILGFARALYGTGTGLGTSGIAHSATVTYDARQQGFMAVIANLTSGILISFLISFVIFLAGSLDIDGESILQLVQSFEDIEHYGREAIVITIMMMSLAAILAWGYYVEAVAFFLFGEHAVWGARIFWVLLLPFAGLTVSINFSHIHEFALALMAVPNFIAIISVLAHVREVEHLNKRWRMNYFKRLYYYCRTAKRVWFG